MHEGNSSSDKIFVTLDVLDKMIRIIQRLRFPVEVPGFVSAVGLVAQVQVWKRKSGSPK